METNKWKYIVTLLLNSILNANSLLYFEQHGPVCVIVDWIFQKIFWSASKKICINSNSSATSNGWDKVLQSFLLSG